MRVLTPDSLKFILSSKPGNHSRVWMNARDYANIRKMGSEEHNFVVEPDATKWRLGIMGRIFGVEIRVSKCVPVHSVCVISDGNEEDLLDPKWSPTYFQLIGVPDIEWPPKSQIG
jgi:hypothetical protein